ncbi:NXPE family member 1-like isoform X5 [Ambystoma mexicanum]|uniref:NXPE family member 1-like isoform X5 n=1 Tax=Ambystoma mexicanum TaxID=8296 RepID=UPI0037E76062
MCPSRMGVALTCRCVSVMGVRCYVSVLLVLRGLSFSRRFCGASETRGRIRRAPGHFLLGRPSTYHNNMHQEAIRGTKLIVALMVLLTCISLTYYSLQTKHLFSKLQNFRYFYRDCAEDPQVKVEVKIAVTETDLEITEIFNEINKTISNVPFIHLNRTTSAEKSKVTILDPKDKYCIGDNLTVQIDVYDFSGKRKEYGGDFIRARIYSPEVKAGTSGIIVDLKNGSYHVHFTLFWEGKVRVSLLLMHPSEGVSALWRARNQGYKNVYWMGKFVNGTRDVQTECGLKFNTMEELCEYPNHCDGEIFYCIKPEHVPCNELKAMAARIRQNSYLTDLEKTIFDNSNNGVEIKKKFEIIDVINCNSLKFVDLHDGSDWHRNYLALDMDRNLRIQWKKHGHPFITMTFFPIPNDACITNQINELVGNSYTAIVITLDHHFRSFPLEFFLRRAINIRKAVERLLRRSPESKVVIKMGNTRELHPEGHVSDFHGYVHYLAMHRIFKGLNVGVVDAWDMTIAAASQNGHPSDDIVHNEINMFLAYMC